MKRTYVWRDGQLLEVTPDAIVSRTEVMPDIAEFRSPDGTRIGGRSQWREHLKRTDTVEMGHSDIKAAQEKLSAKNRARAEKIERAKQFVYEATPPEGEIRPIDRSRLNTEMKNRLYNRPVPDRKTLINLTIETERDMRRR